MNFNVKAEPRRFVMEKKRLRSSSRLQLRVQPRNCYRSEGAHEMRSQFVASTAKFLNCLDSKTVEVQMFSRENFQDTGFLSDSGSLASNENSARGIGPAFPTLDNFSIKSVNSRRTLVPGSNLRFLNRSVSN